MGKSLARSRHKYCFFVIGHDRRKILHCNVTRNPHALWVVIHNKTTLVSNTRALILRQQSTGRITDSRLAQAANRLAKLHQLLIRHQAQSFAQFLQLDFVRFECDGYCRSPGRGGEAILHLGEDSYRKGSTTKSYLAFRSSQSKQSVWHSMCLTH